jgi:predicted short-subunit dehydrogenase-like oxidoreductase (DUF2520 family)
VLLYAHLRANAGTEMTWAQARALTGGDSDAVGRALRAIEHVFGSQVYYDRYRIVYNAENPED